MAEGSNTLRHDQQQPTVERILAVVRDENKRMHEEVRTLRNQLKDLTGAVAIQSAYMQEYMKQQFMPQKPATKTVTKFKFPLESESDLVDIENAITEDNRQDCVAQMRSNIFKVGTLSSSLTNILSEEMVVNYNIEGMHGKKQLRCYTNFLNALLDAIKLYDASEPAIKQLGRAISNVKDKVSRNKIKLEKNLNSTEVVYLGSTPIDYDDNYDDADVMPSKDDDEDFNAKQIITKKEQEYLITELVDESVSKLNEIEFPLQTNADLEEVDNEIANGKKIEYTAKLKYLLSGDILPRTLKNVISKDLIYDSQSRSKKRNLRNIKIWKYEHFEDALLDVIQELHPKEAAKPLLLKSLAAIRKHDNKKQKNNDDDYVSDEEDPLMDI
ncbi:uncharacterized protein Dana_GF27907, isoform B [Drosophila ananassae]|uniref:Uncharacterized protein, isoform A n=1 Tax=Drosophila ananassae TaxID=7217 RepID=A0A0P9APV3_DROAN|nr:uncharacterized protein LOC26515316 isoform X1 [Drosophila ananassae]XP_044574215.1 uncharacterized protein LOC26515316 isoform X1 [Drosophila ananassae]KPU79700.1 uncharacterized protein Dana_GF27907, isoform A [Drosophila ananassae]KPU79701.1 uncharacterized protein Dana_GF27907, isoform B [Drosophila ananassae]